ncbi:MAG: hypothetical protein SGBAC_007778 [Bacillariaceae sp.]
MLATKVAFQTFARTAAQSTPLHRGQAAPLVSGLWKNASIAMSTTPAGTATINYSVPSARVVFPDSNSVRSFSTAPKTVGKLDPSVVATITEELKQVDKNEDGRLDANELSTLLQKHNSAFTHEEILEARDMFYAGQAGGGLKFDEFIDIIEKVTTKPQNDHPILNGNFSSEYIYRKSHAYTNEELAIELTHTPPENMRDRLAYNSVKGVRAFFDTITGWNSKAMTKDMVMYRVIFLETIAAVPGFIAAITRHFKSLRNMEKDGGLLHLFLEEANNERMHLLSFIKMKNPGTLFRGSVVVSQFGFGSAFLGAYMMSPKFCHRFVGYVEEEACSTYTKIIDAIETAPEGSELASWQTDLAPKIALGYWELGENGTVLDLMYAIRADEAEHRDVNHATSELALGQINPYNDPEMKVSILLRKYVRDIMSRDDKLIPA